MTKIVKPSILRIAQRAGAKSLTDESYDKIREIIRDKLSEILTTTITVNRNNGTKTIMQKDLYTALELRGHKVMKSDSLSSAKCSAQ